PPASRLPLPLNLPLINSLRDRRVILASASPRRKQLLAQIGLTKLEIKPSTLPEDIPKSLAPFEYVLQTATQKATHVYSSELDNVELGEPAVVLAADTIVVSLSGQILEKPRSEADHIAMLKMLRNTGSHRVFTAVVAMSPLTDARHPGYATESTVEETTVKFGRDISDEVLLAYVRTREGVDKAGGYAIQGIGAILVERIEGSWDNVVGLPLRPTLGLIEKVLGEDEDNLD
ncbi:Maf-like protein, partial [Usnea florida]